MKTIIKAFSLATFLVCCISCQDKNPQNPVNFYRATSTFRPQSDGSYFISVSDSIAIVATNNDLQKYPFKDGKEKRALLYYIIDEYSKPAAVPGYKHTVAALVQRIDTLVTKAPVAFAPGHDTEYGLDPVGLYLDKNYFPVTVAEDGYLTVCCSIPYANAGYNEPKHELTLLTGGNPKNPYELELRHNGHGSSGPYTATLLVCFPLKSLPEPEGDDVELTLKWNSIASGKTETTKLNYHYRRDW